MQHNQENKMYYINNIAHVVLKYWQDHKTNITLNQNL